MGLIRVLVALHPKGWRERYGEEFTALLEDTRLTPLAVANVVAYAVRERARAHLAELAVVASALLVSVVCHTVALSGGYTHNILWAPTDPLRALLLLGTVGPWVVVTGRWLRRRRTAGARA
ncbi:hypothetical protein GCM10029964_077980 [Kibdelosporangium lantanae]